MSNYVEFLGPTVLAIIGLGLAFFYKSKAETSEAKAIISEVAAKDAPLAAQQAQDEAGIKQVDKGIQDMLDERKKLRDQYLTDQQRADSWKK